MVGREEGSGKEVGKGKPSIRKSLAFEGRGERLLLSPSLRWDQLNAGHHLSLPCIA